MAAPKRTPTERENDLAQIAELYLRGMRQTKIAEQLGIAQQQVSYDLKTIHKRWRESALVNLNEAKHQELARIDELERTYWDAWERSVGEAIKTVSSYSTKDGAKDTTYSEMLVGNPAFLTGVQWCIEQRCKIFGLYEAAKIAIDWRKAVEEQGVNAGDLFERMVNAYIRATNADPT